VHDVDACGSRRRQHRRHHGCHEENDGGGGDHKHPGHLHVLHEAGDDSRERESSRGARHDPQTSHPHALAENSREHVSRRRADGQADAELARPAAH
jgi:hypothetical protein